MDRLDGGRDPASSEPPAIRRIEQLDVLESRHERNTCDGRLECVEGGPDPVIPDRVDDRGDPGGRGPGRERGKAFRRGDEDAALGSGGDGPPGFFLDRLEERRRPRRQRAVGEELQPAEPRPIRPRAERVAAPQPGFPRRVDLFLANAGVNAERQPAALRQAPVRPDRPLEALLDCQGTRVVDRDHAELDELVGERRDQPVVAFVGRARDVVGDEPSRRLVEDAGRLAVRVAPDDAARWIVGVARDAGRHERPAADP